MAIPSSLARSTRGLERGGRDASRSVRKTGMTRSLKDVLLSEVGVVLDLENGGSLLGVSEGEAKVRGQEKVSLCEEECERSRTIAHFKMSRRRAPCTFETPMFLAYTCSWIASIACQVSW